MFTRRGFFLSASAIGLFGCEAVAALPSYDAEAFVDSIGVNIHLASTQTPSVTRFDDVVMPALAELGVRRLRHDLYFAATTNGSHPQFTRLKRAAALGIRLSLVCFDRLNPYTYTPPERLPDIFAWTDGAVDVFEGSNEPRFDPANAQQVGLLIEHQQQMYAVKTRTPALAAVAIASPSIIKPVIEAAPNMEAMIDYGNIHPYPGREHPETTGPGSLTDYLALAAKPYGSKPVIVTENGYHTALNTASSHLPVSPAVRAKYLPRLLLWSFLRGVRQTYIYELISSFADDGGRNPESAFGLLTFDGAKTPGYEAVRALLQLFRGGSALPVVSPGLNVSSGAGVYGAQFKRKDGNMLIPLWLGVASKSTDLTGAVAGTAVVQLTPPGPLPMTVQVHRFGADGRVVASALVVPTGGVAFEINDYLTVIECPAVTPSGQG